MRQEFDLFNIILGESIDLSQRGVGKGKGRKKWALVFGSGEVKEYDRAWDLYQGLYSFATIKECIIETSPNPWSELSNSISQVPSDVSKYIYDLVYEMYLKDCEGLADIKIVSCL